VAIIFHDTLTGTGALVGHAPETGDAWAKYAAADAGDYALSDGGIDATSAPTHGVYGPTEAIGEVGALWKLTAKVAVCAQQEADQFVYLCMRLLDPPSPAGDVQACCHVGFKFETWGHHGTADPLAYFNNEIMVDGWAGAGCLTPVECAVGTQVTVEITQQIVGEDDIIRVSVDGTYVGGATLWPPEGTLGRWAVGVSGGAVKTAGTWYGPRLDEITVEVTGSGTPPATQAITARSLAVVADSER
jgi:hypothetical protein